MVIACCDLLCCVEQERENNFISCHSNDQVVEAEAGFDDKDFLLMYSGNGSEADNVVFQEAGLHNNDFLFGGGGWGLTPQLTLQQKTYQLFTNQSAVIHSFKNQNVLQTIFYFPFPPVLPADESFQQMITHLEIDISSTDGSDSTVRHAARCCCR